MDHTHQMVAAQYEEYVRTTVSHRHFGDDEPRPSLRRRTARRLRRVADAVDPGDR